MESKNAPLAIGGAALAAFLLAPLGSKLVTPPDSSPQPSAVAPQAARPGEATGAMRSAGLMRDESGPWYAICQEFAHPQPDGSDVHIPPNITEIDASTKTLQGDVDAVEISRDTSNKLTTKYSLKEHPSRKVDGCLAAGQHERLLFMVVGVADPSATHSQLATDRAIEAIQHAATLMEYDFDRYWLPWADPSKVATPKGQREAALQEEQPGILIFTKHGKVERSEATRLIVFLYGESPTFGANRLQLQNALTDIDVLSSKNAEFDLRRAPIGYVGAYFSASYPSISEILRSPENKNLLLRIAIVNANSADDELISAFQVSVNKQIRSYESVDLRSTRIVDEAVRLANRLGYKHDEIAILSEDESAFGTGIVGSMAQREARRSKSGRPESPKKEAGQNSKPKEQDDEKTIDANRTGSLESLLVARMYFPRDLSALRNAGDSQSNSPGVVEIGGIAVPTLDVPLTLHEGGPIRQDSPISYAPDQSAASINRALHALVYRLRLQRIQFVVLTSSNPLDTIYLLDYLHRAVPDIRLATIDADQFMLGRPKYVDFSGTLVVSGLPLFSDHEVSYQSPPAEGPPEKRTLQVDFPDGSSEGIYLAVANLLTTDVTEKYSWPKQFVYEDANKNEYPTDCGDGAVLGRNGFNLLSDVDEKSQHYPCQGPDKVRIDKVRIERKQPEKLRLPWAWVVALLLVAVATSLHLLLTLASYPKSERLSVLRTGIYVVDPEPRVRGIKKFFYFALNNQLLLIEFMVVTVTWGVHDILTKYQRALLFLHVGLLLMTLALFFMGLWELASESAHGENQELRSGLGVSTMVFSLLYVVWTAWMWMELLRNGGTTQPWFAVDGAVALRSISLGDGVSPLASIFAILVAYALWALNNMRRLSFVETRRASMPLPEKNQPEVVVRLYELCGKISETLLKSFVMGPLIIGLMAIAYSAIGLFRIWYGLRGIDQEVFRQWSWHWSLLRAWDLDKWNLDLLGFRTWMVVWGFGSLLVLVISSAGKIWEAWMALRQLTQALELTPVRYAFDYVPKELSALQIWHIGGARESFLLQSRTIDVLRLFATSKDLKQEAPAAVRYAQEWYDRSGDCEPPQNGTSTDKNAAKCTQSLKAIQEVVEKGDIPSYEDSEEMNCSLNCRMQEAAERLTRVPDAAPLGLIVEDNSAREQPSKNKSTEKDGAGEATPPPPDIHELYLAYRFVAIFRYTLLQIRNMLWFLVYGYTCLLVSIAVYPFQGRRSLGSLLSLVFLTLLVGVAMLMFQMDRDPILRRLDHPTGTVGNFLSVASNLIMVGGIPLLAVLASQFPSVADFFSSWVRPLVGSLH